MLKRTIHIILLCFVCALSAHAQQLYFAMQVRQPSPIRVASSVNRLLVLNNMQLTDATRACLIATANTLEELERFDEVSVLPIPFSREDEIVVVRALVAAQADSLCAQHEVDALLVLNGMVVDDKTYAEPTDDGWDVWTEAYLTARWTIHYSRGTSQSYTTADTLMWETHAYTQQEAIEALPSHDEMLRQIAAYEGEQMARRITPEWVTQDRYLYRNDDAKITDGIEHFRHQRWSDAIASWQGATSLGGEQAAYASANIALAYEMQDRLDDAIVWAKRAIAAFRRIKTPDAAQQVVNLQFYLSQLQTRKTYVF